LELPTTHRLPLSWLYEAASPPLQYRALAEAAPESARDPERLAALRAAVLEYKPATAIARKQRDTGLWGELLEMGWTTEQRPFRLADRFLFRLLSRDEAPELLVEFRRSAKADPGLGLWARGMGREAAAAALARAGYVDDPRLRGTAHRMASDISQFIRSELATKPFRKAHGKTILEPTSYPPTVFSVEMFAFLPALQRERSGFVERLAQYFSTPAPRRAFFIQAGKKVFRPMFEVLGDPLRGDATGHITDVPFALYWLELLARLGLVRQIASAHKVLARLFSECDDQGIWSPKALRTAPKTTNPVVAHYFPLEGPGKSPAQRQTDVTFRLALIARLLGIPVEVV